MRKQSKIAFTLVELIVVITILAILGTIAFISLQGYSTSARDSVRISNIKNIVTGLELIKVKSGKVPIPEDKIDINANGSLIGYQGYVGDRVLDVIGVSRAGKDPIDESYFTYMTDKNLTKYQIMGFLEGNNEIASNFGINKVKANLIERIPYVKGNNLGIMVELATNIPVQVAGNSIDIVTTSTQYKAYLDNEIGGSITGTGLYLTRIGSNLERFTSCKQIIDKYGQGIGNGIYTINLDINSIYNSSIDAYCNMKTDGGGWMMVVAQFETDPITNWNEGTQFDYDPSLFTVKSFALNTSQIPAGITQIAFGKDFDATFIGYSDFVYTTGNIPKTFLYNYKDNETYHVHRDQNSFYDDHDPEKELSSGFVSNNTLTYDKTGSYYYSWAFTPNDSLNRRGYGMNGYLGNTGEIYAWTVWVR